MEHTSGSDIALSKSSTRVLRDSQRACIDLEISNWLLNVGRSDWMRSCMRCCSNYSTVSKEKYKFISTQWRYWRTLVAWIDSSNSPIHEEAKEEFSVSLVAASILYRIFDETSTGIALLGRCSGIGNAIRNARHKPAWRSGEQRQECALCTVRLQSYTTTWTWRPVTHLLESQWHSSSDVHLVSSHPLYRMLGRVFLLLATIGMFHGKPLISSQLSKFKTFL